MAILYSACLLVSGPLNEIIYFSLLELQYNDISKLGFITWSYRSTKVEHNGIVLIQTSFQKWIKTSFSSLNDTIPKCMFFFNTSLFQIGDRMMVEHGITFLFLYMIYHSSKTWHFLLFYYNREKKLLLNLLKVKHTKYKRVKNFGSHN